MTASGSNRSVFLGSPLRGLYPRGDCTLEVIVLSLCVSFLLEVEGMVQYGLFSRLDNILDAGGGI